MPSSVAHRRVRPIEQFSTPILVVPLVLLAGITGYGLFLASDPRVNELFPPCLDPDAAARGPFSSIPVIGPPACCLVSFFNAAMDSRRSALIMGQIFSYIGAALTALTVESARESNQASWMIRNPTPAWLVFNLAGGALVWQLAMVPSFIHHRKKEIEGSIVAAASSRSEDEAEDDPATATAKLDLEGSRCIPAREGRAIPIAVALGYALPSLISAIWPTPKWILIWLYFPLYVSVIRVVARRVVAPFGPAPKLHPESNGYAFLTIYALPIICSIISHYWFLYDILFVADDRTATTRAALRFIEFDVSAIAVTVLYWIFVVAGPRVALLSVVSALIAGPGAGLCFAWAAREWELKESAQRQAVGQRREGQPT